MPDSETSSISTSLLVRVQNHDEEAWRRLVSIYSPLVYRWCRRSHLKGDESMDVVQDVFRSVIVAIGHFRREQQGDTFQGWLRTITRNKVRDFFRAASRWPTAVGGTGGQRRLEDIAAELEEDEPADRENERNEIIVRALSLVRTEFEDRTWTACWRTAVEDHPPAEVAKELGMTVGAVYQAKSRVLARLRLELNGLADI